MKWMTCSAFALALLCVQPKVEATGADVAPAVPAAASQDHELKGAEVEALFSPDADPSVRAEALKRAVKLAMAGDGRAAFDLGVLYRHGPAHPSRAVELNVDTARYWLEKCVESEHCPYIALASLAELELKAGNDKAAMEWAQAWVAVEKALEKKRNSGGRKGSDAYSAYLLSRCYERLDKRTRSDLATQWFGEFVGKRGAQLDRMLDRELKNQREPDERWSEFFLRKSNHVYTLRPPDVPSMGLFLLRAAPAGGRAESVVLIEALPTPNKMGDFRGMIGRFDSKPYTPTERDPKRYTFLPIQFDDPRYGLSSAD